MKKTVTFVEQVCRDLVVEIAVEDSLNPRIHLHSGNNHITMIPSTWKDLAGIVNFVLEELDS